MCRSIKVLRQPDRPATEAEIEAAARQFVRKISGYSKPSRAVEAPFENAVRDVAASAARLLDNIRAARPPKAQSPPAPQNETPVLNRDAN